jgi:hypothetical protein
MPRFRFSLLALFGFVTFASVACAGLCNPTKAWWLTISGCGYLCLFFAVLEAIYGVGARVLARFRYLSSTVRDLDKL